MKKLSFFHTPIHLKAAAYAAALSSPERVFKMLCMPVRKSDHVKPAGRIFRIMIFVKIISRGTDDAALLPSVDRFERMPALRVCPVFHLAEYKIFPILRDDVDLPAPVPEIHAQDLISLLRKICGSKLLEAASDLSFIHDQYSG